MAGSLSTRLGMDEGTALPRSIVEFYYKNDQLGDPMVTEEHITAFGWASYQEVDEILNLALRINDFLTGIFIGPIVLGELVTQALGGDMAVAVIGNACAIVACWFLIYYLFSLDGQQTMICVIAIGVVRIAVVTFIIGMIPFAIGNPRETAYEIEHPDQEQLDQAITELERQAAEEDF